MKYSEVHQDLFNVPEEYYLAHCISADFNMGRGIVTEFNKRFNLGKKLRTFNPGYLHEWQDSGRQYDCIVSGRVINLITKEKYSHKPTYDTLRGALERMKADCKLYSIQKVAMPLIGCGLDKLEWGQVSVMIQEIFADTDLEILVCIR